jgi:thiol-disulfide isomerase/thioredoxin
MKLSDYRGKAVVTFRATWCPPCMRVVPHEREPAERLKDRPFALLGVNNDRAGAREEMEARVAKERITWRSWWDAGPDGPIATRWCVEGPLLLAGSIHLLACTPACGSPLGAAAG